MFCDDVIRLQFELQVYMNECIEGIDNCHDDVTVTPAIATVGSKTVVLHLLYP